MRTYDGTWNADDVNAVQATAVKEVLMRSGPVEVLALACKEKKVNKNTGRSHAFTRWINPEITALAVPVVEGITPASMSLEREDYTTTMDFYAFSFSVSNIELVFSPWDVKDPMVEVGGETVKLIRERIRYLEMTSGTTVFYPGALTSRATVNSVITGSMIQKAVRLIKAAKGNPFTSIVKASDGVGTAPIEAAYYAFCSYDIEADLRAIPGFTLVANYPNGSGVHANEFGKYQNVRFFTSPELVAFPNAGAAIGVLNLIGTSNVDVYPVIIVAKDAVHSIALSGSGKEGFGNLDGRIITGATKTDPNNQRTIVAFDWFDTCKITNEAWIARLEVGATLTPA